MGLLKSYGNSDPLATLPKFWKSINLWYFWLQPIKNAVIWWTEIWNWSSHAGTQIIYKRFKTKFFSVSAKRLSQFQMLFYQNSKFVMGFDWRYHKV